MRKRCVVTMAAVACLALPATAPAAITGAFAGHTMSGGAAPCAPVNGVRVCTGGPGTPDLRLKSFDGTPLAFFVTLPATPARGTDGRYPLIVQSHGWGEPPSGPDDTQYGGPSATQLAKDGYAVLQFAARGWGGSCGTPDSRAVDPAACAKGYIRLDDYRYEARDVQNAVGLLVDAGVADPRRVGAMGESYGGGLSLELATLHNRVMLPDGSLRPWRSPKGTRLSLAAATPFASWSDLSYALAPNGRTTEDGITSPTADVSPVGVQKQTIMNGLFLVGNLFGNYAAKGSDLSADLTTWQDLVNAGEPYTAPGVRPMLTQITRYHSPYYLLQGMGGLRSTAPAPMLLANGFTDDVFPVDENLRYYNLERARYPKVPITLFEFDGGHQRGQNKTADLELLPGRVKAFLDHYAKGARTPAPSGVTAITQSCPVTAPSQGPYRAATWKGLHPGEVSLRSAAAQTVLSTAGDPAVGKAFDPVFGGLACTTAPGADQGAGVATYKLAPATGRGYTLLGSPRVTAKTTVTGTGAYLAARLVDVDPAGGREVLVARGTYRLDPARPNGTQSFQLHPGAWRFAAGHVPKLELLGQDAPYARPSNGTFSVTVSGLTLRLPVHERPGGRGVPAIVRKPAR